MGFNGKENDNEIIGEGSQRDYGMRVYDPRLGKFLSIDPLSRKYPELTSYQFASNRPIDGIDLDGLEFFSASLINQAGFAKAITTTVDAEEIGAKNPRMGATVVISKAIYKNYKDGIHGGLDLVGMVPVVGEVPDLLNSALYTAEGNFDNAAFSMAAAIPFFGMASTGVKWAK
ncbi:RHS repeat-associated core domain-containing protein [Chitinophaga sp. CF418]|uniref:RHS repeat-associated core domain-containing protein n=1 Tax=Chitinophaga sp. CF418 TaxID=1855287 RepID=UPI00165F73C5|nr:RHS repeat-associated core domain-containing protein [Chitinophaga sp. CF418]